MYKILKLKIYSHHGIRTREGKKKRLLNRPLTNPIFYIQMLSDLFMKAQYPPYISCSKVPGGYSKNGKIYEREPIHGLSIGAGLIWI